MASGVKTLFACALCSCPISISAPKAARPMQLLDFLKALRCRHDLSRRRHRRRVAAEIGLVLAAGPQRRGAEAPAQGAEGHARSSTCPATTTSSCATISASISAASSWPTTPCTRRPTASAISSSTATSSTSWSATPAGSRFSATAPIRRRSSSTPISTSCGAGSG